MKASIIVSNLEPQGVLLPCISVLCNQDFDDYEVLFTYKGKISLEEQVIIKHYVNLYPHFRVVECSGNRGVALNEAVRQAKGDLIFFVESHCIMDRDWLSRYYSVCQRKKFEVGFMDIKGVDSDCWVSRAVREQRDLVIGRLKETGAYDSFFDLHSSAISKEFFDSIGGFAEDIPSLVEFEFGARVYDAGVKIVKVPKEAVWHFNNSTLKSYERIIVGQGRDRARILQSRGEVFFQKHFPNKTFVDNLSLFRSFRVPLMCASRGMMGFSAFNFKLCESLGYFGGADYSFRKFAAWCHRYGLFKGLR